MGIIIRGATADAVYLEFFRLLSKGSACGRFNVRWLENHDLNHGVARYGKVSDGVQTEDLFLIISSLGSAPIGEGESAKSLRIVNIRGAKPGSLSADDGDFRILGQDCSFPSSVPGESTIEVRAMSLEVGTALFELIIKTFLFPGANADSPVRTQEPAEDSGPINLKDTSEDLQTVPG